MMLTEDMLQAHTQMIRKHNHTVTRMLLKSSPPYASRYCILVLVLLLSSYRSLLRKWRRKGSADFSPCHPRCQKGDRYGALCAYSSTCRLLYASMPFYL